MVQINKNITQFNQTIWATFILFIGFVLTFGLYVYSEKKIDSAYELLTHSKELSNELRNSSNDLTRMARTYVITRDPIYKKHYEEIIDIRDGMAPRPLNYDHIYWDLVLADDKRPTPNTSAVSFIELASKAGLTNQEFAKLSEAKQYSDIVALSENAAMYLISSGDTAANRTEAFKMLHDEAYMHAKYKIMKSINDFNELVETRAEYNVRRAETNAYQMRLLFIALSTLFIFMLWRIFSIQRNILGGSLKEIQDQLYHLGNGDFSTAITVQDGDESSILGWLAQTQHKLKDIDEKRTESEVNMQRITNLYAALSQYNQAIVRCSTQEELFAQICQATITYGGMRMAWIGMYDESTHLLNPVAYSGDGTDYLNGLQIAVDESSIFGRGPTGTAFRENRPFWSQDFQNDPATQPWHQRGETYNWRGSASLPLHLDGTVIGTFTIYTDEINAFDESTQKLLLEMLTDIDYALQNFKRDAERIKSQQELIDSHNLLTSIIDTAPIRIFWKDRNLMYLGCNTVFANDAGKRSPQELLGKDDYQMAWKEQAELYRADDRHIIETGISKLFFEEPQTTPDGEVIWLSTSKVPLYDQNNRIIGILGMYQDITDRKNAERALVESTQRLQTIIQTEPECVKIVDSSGKLSQMNPAGLAMLEADSLEAAQQYGLTDFLLPQYRAAFINLHRQVMKGEEGVLEFEITGLKGTRRWLETHAAPMRNANGEVISLLGITRDITENKRTMSQLHKLSQAVEQSSNAIVITDDKAKIEYVNAAFTTITGYTQSDVVGKNPRLLKAGKTSHAVYDDMWSSLLRGETWHGELTNRRKDGSEYIHSTNISPVIDSNGRTTHYIAIEEDISERKMNEERISYLANFDALTGLPNRIQMDDHMRYTMSLAKRNKNIFAIMFLDLDHFKNINDTLGHSIGDLLLIELSKRLTAALREEDTVSRMGGDEFIILLPDSDANGAAQVAQKLLKSIAKPFMIEEHHLSVTASIGIALYPTDGSTIETLTKNADAAMYRSKQEGRNDYNFFTEEMQASSQRNLQLSNALHQALERNELHLVYQPQISATEARIIGIESLLRWHHPEFGNVSPAEFIPIAEENGLIIPIGEWVLRTAIEQIKRWNAINDQTPMIMAVNISAIQFRHPDLPALITSILEEVALAPQYLEIELTEGAAMYNPIAAIKIMNNLHECGIRLSIDDFGTGYSSLSYLKKFNIYKLKIDQSFVRDISTDPEDKAIVSAIIHMARSLGLITIAEGVETVEQLAYLQEQGCDEIQGYYYSKPLLPEDFEKFVKTFTSKQV